MKSIPGVFKIIRSPWTILFVVVLLLLVLSPTPRDARIETALEQARTAAENGHADTAYLALREAMTLEPRLVSLDIVAADLAYQAGRLEEAQDLLSQVATRDPGEAKTECLLGWILLAGGDLEQAATTQSDRCDDHVSFLENLSQAHLAAGNPADAFATAQENLLLAPGNASFVTQAALLAAVQNPEEALPLLRASLQGLEDPDDLLPALIRTIEDARPQDNPAFSFAAIGQTFVRHQRWLLARAALEAAVTLEPDYADAHAYLGYTLERLGLEGLPQLQNAYDLNPASSIAAFFLADYWLINAAPERAITILEDLQRLEPNNPAILAEIGAAYAASGDLPTAKSAYLQAISIAPEQHTFWSALAQFSMEYEVELLELGLPAARNALIINPGDPAALDMVGYINLLLGNTNLAERLLRRSLEKDPGHPAAWLHWGLLNQVLGNSHAAQAALRNAIALDLGGPTSDRAQRVLENLSP